MKNWYKDLKTRFVDFDSHIQILHVVSDLKKANNLIELNRDSAVNHLYRAIILLDYIIYDPKWQGKLKECLRLRETIASIINGTILYATINQAINAALLLDVNAYKTLNVKRET